MTNAFIRVKQTQTNFLYITGVSPPNLRDESLFDAGAKYHVAANVGYVRYFTAHIYEFQFYRALCLESGEYVPNDPAKPLHRCNFFGKLLSSFYAD